jgi:hypothetical protein
MEFGKRLPSDHPDNIPTAVQETCVRCYGTGHVRERGNRFRCKVCGGSGRLTVATEPESKAASAV